MDAVDALRALPLHDDDMPTARPARKPARAKVAKAK
jgi:hypothetical protein